MASRRTWQTWSATVALACGALACGESAAPAASTGDGAATVTDAVAVVDVLVDTSPVDAAATDASSGPDTAPLQETELETVPQDLAPDGPASASDAVDAAAPIDAGPPCTKNSDCPDPKVPCLEARCQVATKTCTVVQSVDAVACDDGDICTVGDNCQDGACKSGKPGCGCPDDDACAALDDGNLCNGKLYCDKKQMPAVCSAKPGSVVVCPPTDSLCLLNVCNPLTGACDATPTNQGGPCEDGKICTDGDLCLSGACVAGPDSCLCKQNGDCTDDGNLCNGTPYCDKSALPWSCQINPGTVVNCSAATDTPCSKNTCNPKTGACAYVAVNDGGPCEDGQVCTVGDNCKAGACAAGGNACGCQADADCKAVEDNDLCNGTLFCNKTLAPHLCQINPATVVTCPSADDTACSKNLCNAKTGKCAAVLAKDGTPCDDANPCTPDDACHKGACKAVTNLCACTATDDCKGKDDGDLCNGTLYCDKAKLPYVCAVNPATVVSCPSGGDSACSHNLCQKANGQCAMIALPDGSACDADGTPCTTGDACKAGGCKAGPNVCVCQTDADCAGQEDGNPCNGSLYCDKLAGSCKVNPNTVVACSPVADTFCIANLCNPQTGKCQMTQRNQGQACDADGNPCTEADACDAGMCVVGANICSCTADAQCAPFEDGNPCNGSLYCNKAKVPFQCAVNPATVVKCDSGNPPACHLYACDPKVGKCGNLPLVNQSPCEDGSLCTFGDTCLGGQCIPGSDLCGCYADADCANNEDGNLCNGTLYCDKTQLPFQCKVKPATLVVCKLDNDTACTKAQCDPKTGVCKQAAIPPGAPCNDGNACTGGDACLDGGCAGKKVSCDDQNPCTFDSCDVVDGCIHELNAAAACDDDNACTADSCGAGGCSHAAKGGSACDDHNPCTGGDACAQALCQGMTATGCDDSNPCTDDACAGDGKTCLHTANAAPCSLDRLCHQGQCGGCTAWRRIARGGCAEVSLLAVPPSTVPANCKYISKAQREELDEVAVLSTGQLLAVGAASTDGTQATRGWAVWHDEQGAWQFERTYLALDHTPATGVDRLLAVAPRQQGGAWLAGVGQGPAPTQRPWLLRVDGKGDVQTQLLLPPPAGSGATDLGRFDGVAALPDGGALAVGRLDNPKAGATDALLARVDAAGLVLWSKLIGQQTGSQTAVAEQLWAVAAQPDGQGVWAVGQRGNPKAPSQQQDAWVLRLDLQGNPLWSKSMGTTQHEALFALMANTDGTWTLGGVRNAQNGLAPGDGWLVQLAGDGSELAQWLLPDDGGEVVRALGSRPGGGWIAVGTRTRDFSGDKAMVANNYDKSNAWAVAVDAVGKPVWQREFDQYGLEDGRGGCTLPGGDMLLAGATRPEKASNAQSPDMPDGLLLRIDGPSGQDGCDCHLFVDLPAPSTQADLPGAATLDGNAVLAVGHTLGGNGFADGWLHAVSAEGKVLWDKVLDKPGIDRLLGVARGPGGTWLAVGSSSSAGAGKQDGWLLLLDATGKVLVDKTVGAAEDDVLLRAEPLPNGGWVAVGYSYSASKGLADGWIIGVDNNLAVQWELRQGDAKYDQFGGVALVGWGATARVVAVGFRSLSAPGSAALQDEMVTVLEQDGSIAKGKDGMPLQYYYDYTTGKNGNNVAFDELDGIARTKDGGAVAIGRATAATLSSILVTRFDAQGERIAATAIDKSVAGAILPNAGILYGVVPLPDGGLVGYGMVNYSGPDVVAPSWTLRLSAKNALVWQHVGSFSAVGDARLKGGVRLAGQQLVLTGVRQTAAGHRHGLVARLELVTGESQLDPTVASYDPPCLRQQCDPSAGPRPVRQTGNCDDGDACLDLDRCLDGACIGAATHDCNDGNLCTTDTCTATAGCLVTPSSSTAACSGDALCASGNCGVCPWTLQAFGDPKVKEFAVAGAPATQGGWWLVGYHTTGAQVSDYDGSLVARVDTDGAKAIWQFHDLLSSGEELLQGVAATSDGGAWAVGWSQAKAAGVRNKVWARVDAVGKLVSLENPDEVGPQAWFGVATDGKGNLVAAGYEAAGPTSRRPAAHARDSAGKQLWNFAHPANAGEFTDVAAVADGWVVAGDEDVKNSVLVTRLSAAGIVQWSTAVASPSYVDVAKIVPLPSGDLLLVARQTVSGQSDVRTLRFSGDGTLLGDKILSLDGNQLALGAHAAGNGLVVVAQAASVTGTPSTLAMGIGAAGQLVWTGALAQAGGVVLHSVFPRVGGGSIGFGLFNSGGDRHIISRSFSASGAFFCGPK